MPLDNLWDRDGPHMYIHIKNLARIFNYLYVATFIIDVCAKHTACYLINSMKVIRVSYIIANQV